MTMQQLPARSDKRQPILIVVGGFLGAGKTTALLALAERLEQRGLRTGLITNDQGIELVDAALVKARGWAGTAVEGGCFCCRFDDLTRAAEMLQAQSNPDVLLAEPVGSCTDIVATVLRPIERLYANRFRLAPFSVLVDAQMLEQHRPGNTLFGPDVNYLYERQIAEADLVVFTKADLLDGKERTQAHARLEQTRPGAETLLVSARSGEGMDVWLDRLLEPAPASQRILDLDYDRYAAAEAALGWLNAAVDVQASASFGLDTWVETLLTQLRVELDANKARIAHLKVQAQDDAGAAKASIIREGDAVAFDLVSNTAAHSARALINARAVADPATLENIVRRALQTTEQTTGTTVSLTVIQSFAPARPQPTHRDV